MSRYSAYLLVFWCLGLAGLAAAEPDPQQSESDSTPMAYVAVSGDDAAAGTSAAPVATLKRAVELLPKGGVIHLRKGIYRETATLEGGADAPPLHLQAEEGVIFDGGERLAGWERLEGSLYATELPSSVQETRSNLHLWDRKRLLRFTRLADEAAVRLFPDTFFLRADGRVVAHLSEGSEPDGITCNRVSKGVVIQRPRVTVEGIAFRDYFFNAYSAALTVGEVREVKVLRCRFENVRYAVQIAPLAEAITISHCEIRFAGTAINNRGNHVTIRENLFEGATGRFAIPDLLTVLNCAIRVYHPAIGVTIAGNVTAGFAYGLRIKTQGATLSREENHAPFVIEHNTFCDGVNMTPQVHEAFREGDRFGGNIVFVGTEEAGLVKSLREHGATVEANYLYPALEGNDPGGSNETGPPPFADLNAGDLKPVIDLPRSEGGLVAGAGVERVRWLSPAIFAQEKPVATVLPSSAPPARDRGRPATLHVRPGADPATADGSAEQPYPVLQGALDHVMPGDTVLLSEGVHVGPATLTRSGTAEAPVTIRGAGPLKTILEGARRIPVLLTLSGVKHVRVEQLQFRWFRETGLRLEKCESVRIEGCRFLNGEFETRTTPVGYGVFAQGSPRITMVGNLLTRNRVGIKLVASPGAVLENNTGFRNLNTALEMVRSCRDSVIRRNSFGFSSHAAIYLWEPDAAALRSLRCDENNYAMRLYNYRVYDGGGDPEVEPMSVPARYGSVAGGKAVVDVLDVAVDGTRPRTRYHQLEAWRKASGKDRHSLFTDPEYADPAKGDFRLLPSSPNLRADGSFIGAFGPLPYDL